MNESCSSSSFCTSSSSSFISPSFSNSSFSFSSSCHSSSFSTSTSPTSPSSFPTSSTYFLHPNSALPSSPLYPLPLFFPSSSPAHSFPHTPPPTFVLRLGNKAVLFQKRPSG